MSSRFFLSFSPSLPRLSRKQRLGQTLDTCTTYMEGQAQGALMMKDNGKRGKGKHDGLWGSVLPTKFSLLISQLRNPAHLSESLLTQYPDGSKKRLPQSSTGKWKEITICPDSSLLPLPTVQDWLHKITFKHTLPDAPSGSLAAAQEAGSQGPTPFFMMSHPCTQVEWWQGEVSTGRERKKQRASEKTKVCIPKTHQLQGVNKNRKILRKADQSQNADQIWVKSVNAYLKSLRWEFNSQGLRGKSFGVNWVRV